MWNGTTATLKPRPTISRPMPISSSGEAPCSAAASDSAARFVVPRLPYTVAMP